MEWLALLVSVLLNWFQYGQVQELEVKLDVANGIATACQAAKNDTRKVELRASNERIKTETAIRRVAVQSKLDTRDIVTLDNSDGCSSVLYPSGTKRVESHIKRTKAINSEWLRSTSVSDEQ